MSKSNREIIETYGSIGTRPLRQGSDINVLTVRQDISSFMQVADLWVIYYDEIDSGLLDLKNRIRYRMREAIREIEGE